MPKPTPHPNHNKTDAQFAKDWWSAETFRLLPGEQDGHTVFVIDFYEGFRDMTPQQTNRSLIFCLFLGAIGTILWASDLIVAAYIFWIAIIIYASMAIVITIWPLLNEAYQYWRNRHEP